MILRNLNHFSRRGASSVGRGTASSEPIILPTFLEAVANFAAAVLNLSFLTSWRAGLRIFLFASKVCLQIGSTVETYSAREGGSTRISADAVAATASVAPRTSMAVVSRPILPPAEHSLEDNDAE